MKGWSRSRRLSACRNASKKVRGFVVYEDCDNPLTSCWSKSKTGKKHPYYMCFHKPCGSYRKSVRRDEIEGAFEDVLSSVVPSKTKLSIAARMFATIWDGRLARAKEQAALYEAKIKDLDKQSTKLLDRLIEADSKTVITAYETRISKLEQEKLLLAEKAASTGQPHAPFEQMFELAMNFPANLCKVWKISRFDLQHLALKLTFSE